jgi:hypothetical protein
MWAALVVGFTLHWIGPLVAIINWDLATRFGRRGEGLLPKYRDSEHAVALANVENFDTPILDPVPGIRLLRDASHTSLVELPIVHAW